jgi:hypothetical protein
MVKRKSKPQNKMFVIKKYVMAPNAREAIKRERKVEVDDLWVDEDWRKNKSDRLADAIGFTTSKTEPEE